MIILTAGHTGPSTGAQSIVTQFDEGAENIWLRNRIAEILTNKYGLVVLMDNDTASLKLLTKALTEDLSHTEPEVLNLGEKLTDNTEDAVAALAENTFINDFEQSEKSNSVHSVSSVREKSNSVRKTTFLIDIHFNAHSNPQARGTEAIIADSATTLELRFASRLSHIISQTLNIPLRSIKTESQTPHRRLGILHITPQSIILEICFCTSPEDVLAYREHRETLAQALAHNIAQLLTINY